MSHKIGKNGDQSVITNIFICPTTVVMKTWLLSLTADSCPQCVQDRESDKKIEGQKTNTICRRHCLVRHKNKHLDKYYKNDF